MCQGTSARMTEVKNTGKNKCWQWFGERGTLI